jgi:phospholipase/carboxylesterase
MNTTPLTFLERPAAGAGTPWLLVLMHGVGSNEQDLFGLAPYVPPHCHVLSLRAPFVLGPGSFAWFEFDVRPDGSRSIDGEQEQASRQALTREIAVHAERLGVPPARVLVGGFSQGGIMALSLLLTEPALMHGAFALHSRLLPEVLTLAAPAAELAGKQLWVSHGLQDMVIPLAQAQRIREHFGALPVTLDGADFPGGHELRPAELQQWIGWLQAITHQETP